MTSSGDLGAAAFYDLVQRSGDWLLSSIDRLLLQCIRHGPQVESALIELFDAMFAPRQMGKQLTLIAALQVVLSLYNAGFDLSQLLVNVVFEKGRRQQALMQQLSKAGTYAEWKRIAERLDRLRGLDQWRREETSSLYDCRVIKKRIQSTVEMLERGDAFDLVFRLRGALSRDQFGMQHEGLFSRAMAGTKLLVEEYHDTMALALNFICDSPIADEEIPTDAKLAFFNETRHAYGRTALLLSGGAYLGYYHMGVVKALFDESLLPRVISGASAGSIITGIIGTRTDPELKEMFSGEDSDHFPTGIRTDFFRFSNELQSEVARRLNYLVPQGLRWLTFPIFSIFFEKKLLNLDTEHFKKAMIHNIGLYTFQEAFDHTGRIINITVAPLNNYDPPRLLNYLTAPHVCVWSAAAASCALPGIFDPIPLLVKEPNGQFRPEHEWTRSGILEKEDVVKSAYLSSYSDGSLENDLPMQQLSELFNVNHFIVSQVNPHSAILSSLSLKATVWSSPLYGALVGCLRFLTAQCRDWLKNIVNLLVFRSKAPVWSARRGITQTLTQDYEGRDVDVTIMPWSGHISSLTALMSAIKNPTVKEFMEVLHVGAANTWPSISRIKAHCLVEMTLDKCVQRLRKRISEESVQKQMMSSMMLKKVDGNDGDETIDANIDRTPSFYTTRSIVNLSGLSVADPPPYPMRPSSTVALDAPDALRALAVDRMRRKSIDHVSTSNNRISAEQHNELLQEEYVSQSLDEQDFLTFNVMAGEIPLSQSAGREENNSGISLSELKKNYSCDNLKDENVIHKTTTMAKFYYKKSLSEEKLAAKS